MEIRYQEVGVCGLSCRLCPHFHTEGASRCTGCKGEYRMGAACPFITCAVKRRGIEFCWECDEGATCERWARHREASHERDSFVCYARLDDNIAFVEREGVDAFVAEQEIREGLLREMLAEFNEGRSKTYYSIAATMLSVDELQSALREARLETAEEPDAKVRAKALHALLDAAASSHGIKLTLRK